MPSPTRVAAPRPDDRAALRHDHAVRGSTNLADRWLYGALQRDRSAMRPALVHVCDDPMSARRVEALLVGAGYDRVIACSYNRFAGEVVEQLHPDLVLVTLGHDLTRAEAALLAAIIQQEQGDGATSLVCAPDPAAVAAVIDGGTLLGQTVAAHDLRWHVATALAPLTSSDVRGASGATP